METTQVTNFRREVLRRIAKYTWNDCLPEHIYDILYEVVTDSTPRVRCCVHKERAVLKNRIQMALWQPLGLNCFSSSIFPHFRHSTSPLSSWEIPHFQQALSGYRFHNCVLPHKGMFHSVASSTSHQEMAVVSQSVNHGSGHLFIGEDACEC